MKPRDFIHLPRLADIGEFGKTEFASGIADVRSALIDEAWFDRTTSSVTNVSQSLGWELPEDRRGDPGADDPFGRRWSASDHAHQHGERDHPHELDFDR